MLSYFKGSLPSLNGKATFEFVREGDHYGFYCEDKFIGQVSAQQLHKYIDGMEIEYSIYEED